MPSKKCCFFKNNKKDIFHENSLLADDLIKYLLFFRKLGKMSQNLSPAAVVIGPLSVNSDMAMSSKTVTLLSNLSKQTKINKGHLSQNPILAHMSMKCSVSFSDQSMSVVCDESSTICFK